MRLLSRSSSRRRSPRLSACGGGAPASPSDVFKIGVVLPLTGSTAWGGQPARIAAELAAQEVNEQHLAGDYRLELVFADGACAPRTAYAAADKLFSQDRVEMLIGEWCSSASIAAAQVASDAQGADARPDLDRRRHREERRPVCVSNDHAELGHPGARGKLLLEKFKFKTAAILVENNDFGLSFRNNMRRSLEQRQRQVVLDVPQDRQDANWYIDHHAHQGRGPGPGRDLDLRRSGGQLHEAIRREQPQDAAVLRLHAAALHLREAGGRASRPHRPGPRHLFRDGPASTPRQKAFVAASSRSPSGRSAKPARRALGHRHLRCRDYRGGRVEARRREHRGSAEVARLHAATTACSATTSSTPTARSNPRDSTSCSFARRRTAGSRS